MCAQVEVKKNRISARVMDMEGFMLDDYDVMMGSDDNLFAIGQE